MDDSYQLDWEEICKRFDVDPDRGLSDEQVQELKKKYGSNGEIRGRSST